MRALSAQVDPNADTPPSRQLVERVLDLLAAGELAADEQLPSVRQLAARALVNHNTAARAYRDLEQLGVVRGRNGLGVFVTADGPRVAHELRAHSTLLAFHRAAHEALRAGHPLRDLVEGLSAAASEHAASRRAPSAPSAADGTTSRSPAAPGSASHSPAPRGLAPKRRSA